MKNTMKCFTCYGMRILNLIALALIGFLFAACSNGTTGNGGDTHNAKTYTYTGTVDGVMYTLKIDGCTCAGLTPKIGDNYTLTVGGKTSTGAVTSFKLWVLRLEPFNSTITFTVTVSGISITAMSGTITWSDDTAAPAPTGPWGTPVHTHAYSSEWSYNETQHWHECTANDGVKTDVADHTFIGTICLVCYYIMGSGGGPSNWTWTAVADSTFGTYQIKAIAYGNNTWVAVGSEFVSNVSWYANKIAYSTDNGVTWTAVANTTFEDQDIFDIAWGNGRFVAVGGADKIAYSDDGINWTAGPAVTFDSNRDINSVAYGGSIFVAGGEYSIMAYSSDGSNWTRLTMGLYGGSSGSITAIAYGNNRWVVGNNGRDGGGKMAYSDDGVNWTVNSAFYTTHELAYIPAIAWGNNRFLLAGRTNPGERKFLYSADGETWTAAGLPFDYSYYDVSAIAYGNGRFVAVGESGRMAYSADGASWTQVADSKFGTNNNDITAIAYGNGRFVAVGENGKMAYADWGE